MRPRKPVLGTGSPHYLITPARIASQNLPTLTFCELNRLVNPFLTPMWGLGAQTSEDLVSGLLLQ